MSTDSDVEDYGTSDFNGRPLETAFAQVFGRIADPEFNMTRGPFVAGCGDEDAIKLWKSGHKFQSRWTVAS